AYVNDDPINFTDPSGLYPCGTTTAQNGDTISVTVYDCVSFFGFLSSPGLYSGQASQILGSAASTTAGMLNRAAGRVVTGLGSIIDKVTGNPVIQFGAKVISIASLFEGNGQAIQTAEDLLEEIGPVLESAESNTVALLNKIALGEQEVKSVLDGGI